jgi:hypothetical protein
MTTPLKLGFTLLVGLVAGTPVGVIYARHTIGRSSDWMAQWAALGTYAQLSDLQYRYADEPHARSAVSDFLSFARLAKANGKITDQKEFGIDVARAYVQLAVLDRRAGNAVAYQSDLSSAQASLQAAGSPRASLEDVERSVNQLESRR